MIIVPKNPPYTWQDFRKRLFTSYSLLLERTSRQTRQTPFFFVVELLLVVAFDLSLLLSQLPVHWNCLEINQLRLVMSYVSPQGILSAAGMNTYVLICICLLAFATVNCFTLMAIVLHAGKSPLLLFAAYLFRIAKVLVRPLIHFLIFNVLFSELSVMLRAISGLLAVLYLGVVLLNTKLCFNPISKNNSFYQLDNEYDFVDILMVFVRVVLVCSSTAVRKSIIVLLVLQASRLYCFEQVLASPMLQILCTLPSQLVIILCTFMLSNELVEGIGQPLFYFWSAGVISVVAYKWIQLGLPSNKKLVLPCCMNYQRKEMCRFICVLWQLTKEEDSQKVCHTYCSFMHAHLKSCKLGTCYLKEIKNIFSSALEAVDRARLERCMAAYSLKLLETASLSDEILATQYYLCLHANSERKALEVFSRRIVSLHLCFVVFHFNRILLNETVSQEFHVTEENLAETKRLFYFQFKRTVGLFTSFFRELRLQRTRLAQLQQVGVECIEATLQLQHIFKRVLKNPHLDLIIIEFYLEFLENFIRDTALVNNTIREISKRQIQGQSHDYLLEESPLPTFCINLDKGSIDSVNIEASKLLGWEKNDIVGHLMQQFVVDDDFEDWSERFVSLIDSPVLCLVRSRCHGMLVSKISARVKEHSNKKMHLLEFTELPNTGCAAYAVIEADLTIRVANRETLEKGGHQVSTEDAYRQFIQPNWHQLIKFQSLLIECDTQPLSIAVELCNSFDRLTEMIRIQLRQRFTTKTISDNQSTSTPQNSFFFFLNNVCCSKAAADHSQILQMEGGRTDFYEFHVDQFQRNQTNSEGRRITNYADGIKSYRLKNDRIYNIELQTEESCDYSKRESKAKQDSLVSGCFTNKAVCLVLMAVISLLGFSTALYHTLQQSSTIANTDSLYRAYIRIETFELRYYWLTCIFRDIDLNLSAETALGWQEAQSTLNDIQASQTNRLFTDELRNVEFLEVSYTNNLDELFNVVLTNMLGMVAERNTSISEDIHYLTVHHLQNFTYAEKRNIRDSIQSSSSSMHSLAIFALVAKTVLALVFLLGVACTEHVEMRCRLELIMNLRMMSDQEVDSYLARLQTLEGMLQLTEKSLQVNVYSSLLDDAPVQKRSAPKQCEMGFSQRKSLIVALLAIMVCCVGINVYIFLGAINHSNNANWYLTFNRALAESYINYLYMSIDSENGVSETVLNETSQALSIIEETYQTLTFSDGFNEFISNTYFDDACPEIQTLLPGLDCENFSPQTNYRNPFRDGLDIYFHHVYYNINEESGETIPSTGVTARSFILLIGSILNSTLEEWELFVREASNQLSRFIVLEILQFSLLVLTYSIVRRKQKHEHERIKRICSLVRLAESSPPSSDPQHIEEAKMVSMEESSVELL